MLRIISFFVSIFFLAYTPAAAQEKGRTIFVIDASGSMWGQIDGKAKISIAQKVLNGLLVSMPDDQALGLIAYGHRRKGDCSDIETLVEVATGTKSKIGSAVNALKPKGKTPLSAAVIAAAEELKYTEKKATVILVSDGKETCEFDPCEVGTALEAAGVDFTAHVIGFDVAHKADRAQLQCLAENTGGKFLTASNAAELTDALLSVAKPLPPKDIQIRFHAIDGEGGNRLLNGIVWRFSNIETGEVFVDMVEEESVSITVKPGHYKVEVLRLKDEAHAALEVEVSSTNKDVYTLVLPEYKPLASLDIPNILVAGATIDIGWSGPNDDQDFLSTANQGDRGRQTITYSYTENGQPLGLQMPPEPGQYELRYVNDGTGKILASEMIKVTPFDVSIEVPDHAIAGETLSIDWLGPNYERDYISTANPGDRGSKTITYSYTGHGKPLELTMPPEPGDYEVRYVLNQSDTIAFSKMIKITETTATIEAPETAVAGQTLSVTWRGPNYKRDFLSVADIGSRGSQTINYVYTKPSNALDLVMPSTPGTYEIRYVLNQGNTVLTRRSIEITPVTATISVPATGNAGSIIDVEWDGPAYERDFIAIAEVGARGSAAISYAYTKAGKDIQMTLPEKPGTYEIRYVMRQANTVLAKVEIKVK